MFGVPPLGGMIKKKISRLKAELRAKAPLALRSVAALRIQVALTDVSIRRRPVPAFLVQVIEHVPQLGEVAGSPTMADGPFRKRWALFE